MPPQGFLYNAEYKVMICIACELIIQPRRRLIYEHLNRHRILGDVCKTYVDRISAFELLPFKELHTPQHAIQTINGL